MQCVRPWPHKSCLLALHTTAKTSARVKSFKVCIVQVSSNIVDKLVTLRVPAAWPHVQYLQALCMSMPEQHSFTGLLVAVQAVPVQAVLPLRPLPLSNKLVFPSPPTPVSPVPPVCLHGSVLR